MNPKEKAKELISEFNKIHTLNNYEAKQCALIAVDELIDNCENVFDADYWKEVRQEIELL